MHGSGLVVILTGPCGVGKTTIANILLKKLDIEYIGGDKIRRDLFPELDVINEHPKELLELKKHIFMLSAKHFANDKSVIIDFVMLGKTYLNRFQNVFGKNLAIRVLLPDREVIYERDSNRECWTSGREIIDSVYDKFLNLADAIGEENFIDNANQTPEESAQLILKNLKLKGSVHQRR